ncbi:MAG TPA: DUF4232 domain-containing protein [Acidimicrobiales bacterium]|nr:DUF4232 domain-containing protein [Acidimicrobiales bacterium]
MAIGIVLTSSGSVGLAACGVVASAAVAPCPARAVAITVGQFGVGRGHFGGALLFTNRGHATCTLRGYPDASAVSARAIVALPRAPRGYLGGLLPGVAHPPVVTLAPGAVASAVVEGLAVAASRSSTCTPYGALRIGVPGSSAATTLAIETSSCSALEVHPIVLGRTGNQSP